MTTNPLSPATAARNERILDRVEELGGGFVWDAEVFAVNLAEVAITDAQARALVELVGVDQVAIDCSRTSITTLQEIAAIPGLQSLVLCNPALARGELELLRVIGPRVDVVYD